MAALNQCSFEKIGSAVISGSWNLSFSHCSANFQPIWDCFIPNYKLKNDDSENVKADIVNTVVFNSHQIKRRTFFWDIWYILQEC